MTIKKSFILAALWPFVTGTASAETPAQTGTRSVSVSLDGSADRHGDSRSAGLRAGAGMEFGSLRFGGSALDLNLEAYFAYSRSETDAYSVNVKSIGLDLARIQLSRWGGEELETFKPYLLTGVELSWLKETTEDGAVSSRFLAPVIGMGLEMKLNSRACLNLEYRRNLAGGDRSMSGLTLGLSYALFGAEEEKAEEKEENKEEGKDEKDS